MNKERLYYIDWLRVLVILSLVLYHSALTYTGLGDIYIKVQVNDFRVLPFLIITAPLDNFFMTLLFFLSGIATYYALQNSNMDEYIKERTTKVLIPFIVGTIFLCPLQAYFKGLYNGFNGSYFDFQGEFFSSKIVDYLGYAHLWFLLYLFIISLICVPLFSKWQNERNRLIDLSTFLCKGRNIYLPIVFIVIVETFLRPFFPGKQIIIMDWANDIVYLSIFIFGFVFASSANIQQRLSSLENLSKGLVFVCIIIFIYIDYLWVVYNSTEIYLNFIWAFAKGTYECSAIIVLVGMGKRYFNKKSVILTYLNKASFTYYVFHFLPVSAFTYIIIRTNINIYLKYILVVVLSYVVIFLIYELVVRRLFFNDKIKAN